MLHHAGVYVSDLEAVKDFYVHYFGATCGVLYYNVSTDFRSYMLSFGEGAQLELMSIAHIDEAARGERLGYAHIAMSVGSKEAVDALTARIAADGHTVTTAPRTTGDGYYESCVLDPEGNRVEITM